MLDTQNVKTQQPFAPSQGNSRITLGRAGEAIAAKYLHTYGLSIVDRNWRDGRRGELDLVAFDSVTNHMVFVEVRTRRGRAFGSGLEAITPQKFQQVRRIAGAWLAAHPSRASCRIDLVGVTIPWRPGPALPPGDPLTWTGVDVAWVKGATL